MMTYVAGPPGHVHDKDGETKQEEDEGEHKDHPRTQGEVNLQTQGCNSCTQAGDDSFVDAAAALWNNLPTCDTLATVKRLLKTFLLHFIFV